MTNVWHCCLLFGCIIKWIELGNETTIMIPFLYEYDYLSEIILIGTVGKGNSTLECVWLHLDP